MKERRRSYERTPDRPLLIVSLHAFGAFTQRVDLAFDGFQPVPDTQLQLSPWLAVMTTTLSAGGAFRCVDLRGPARFGGIALVPYTEPGCSGEELERLTARRWCLRDRGPASFAALRRCAGQRKRAFVAERL